MLRLVSSTPPPRGAERLPRAERLEAALLRGAEEALAEARRLVSGEVLRVRSGRLRDGFFAHGGSRGAAAWMEAGNAAPYAALHELGLAGRPARPFLRPALEEKRERITALLARAFAEAKE